MKHITFEIAKLLKEKGFDEPCSHSYKEVENPVLYVHQDKKYNNSFKKEWQNTLRKNSHMDDAIIKRYSAPTISYVVDWIYETYGIDISTIPIREKGARIVYFQYRIIDFRDDNVDEVLYEHQYNTHFFNYSTKQEAYLAGIEYTLNNLI